MKSQLESLRAKQGKASQQQTHLVWQQHTREIRAPAHPAHILLHHLLLIVQTLVFSGWCGTGVRLGNLFWNRVEN